MKLNPALSFPVARGLAAAQTASSDFVHRKRKDPGRNRPVRSAAYAR